ncbi:DUF2723 domain-containing protein [bacterium]|nr:DUF2723 domain-containing protein [bacterium]
MYRATSANSRALTQTSTSANLSMLVDSVLLALLGGGAFFLYLRTLAPVLLPGDSGEFQTLAYLLGNTHPTGYPIYLLLAHPFTWLPVESVAFRVNLFSALMGAVAVTLTYVAGRLLTDRRLAALISAAALAVSTTLWSQAVIAEVYSAGAAFLAAVLVLVLSWRSSGRSAYLFCAGLLGGLSLGVHMTVVLAAPAIVIYLLLTARRNPRAWIAATSGALLGAILFVAAFLYLDWRAPAADFIAAAIQPSRSVWGLAETDLDSPLERFWFSVSGRQFQDRMFQPEAVGKNLWEYASNLGREFHPLALLLVLPGLAWLATHRKAEGALVGIALLAQWIYTFSYNIWDIHVFFIPGYLLLALLLAAGVAAGTTAVESGMHRLLRRWSMIAPAAAAVLVAGILLVTAVWPVLAPRWDDVSAGRVSQFDFDGYPVDHFSMTGLTLQTSSIVDAAPQNAVIFSRWNELYPLYYIAHVEKGRADLTFIEEKPYREGAVSENSTVQFVLAHIDNHPIYFTECLPELSDAGLTCRGERLGMVLYQRITRG